MDQISPIRRSSPENNFSFSPNSERANSVVHDMWERLRRTSDQSGPLTVPDCFVGRNAINVACPLNTSVSVGRNTDRAFLHANTIHFLEGVPPGSRRHAATGKAAVAIAGQSPQSAELCERFLIQGLDSGKGLFQFVSRRAHAFSTARSVPASRESPLIGQLQNEWSARGEVPGSILLGGRYAIVEFKEHSADALHRTHLLTVRDQWADNQIQTIPLTQVAPPFADHVLSVEQIEQANTFINMHNALLETSTPIQATASAPPDPMIISYAGIGRNATLIAYREALSRMDERLDAQGLDAALENIVQQGRRDRGPRFIQSEKQLAALHEALTAELLRRRMHNETREAPASPIPTAKASTTASRLRAQVAQAAVEGAISSDDQIDGSSPTIDNQTPEREPQVENFSTESRSTARSVVDLTSLNLTEISPPAKTTTEKREEIIQFVETHLNDSPLQFFEAVAMKDLKVAAFAAVQNKRMHTADSDFPATGTFKQSMHEEVLVYGEPSSLEAPSLRPAEGSELATLQNNGRQYLQSTQVMLHDLRFATMVPSAESTVSTEDTGSVFPDGLTLALRTGRFDPRDASGKIPQKLNQEELVSLVYETEDFGLDFIEDLAAHNPAAATFFHIVEHALNFNNAAKEQPTKRYEYFEDGNQVTEQQRHSGDKFLPVFLDGVRRDPNFDISGSAEWSGLVNDQWQAIDTKAEVVRHVLVEALDHLRKSESTPGMPIYPLIAYDLLAKAIDVPVPVYLKEHEEKILNTLAENRASVELRQQEIAQAQRDTAILREKQAEETKILHEEYIVSNVLQMHLVSGEDFEPTLAAESTDATISVSTKFTHLDALSAIRLRIVGDGNIRGTHSKQEISSRSHCLGGQDNLCWLRSSWLALFETVTPDDLAARFAAVTGPMQKKIAPYAPALLQAVAQRYRDDPRQFMHAENKGTGAHLGPSATLAEFLGDQLPSGIPNFIQRKSCENYLRGLQISIATAYRAKGSRLMAELEELSFRRSPATSNLPINLHRAMNVPLLVIEAETRVNETLFGRHVNRFGHLRIAAPTGSDLAEQAEPLAKATEPDLEQIEVLMRAFDDKPVLWLEGGHYDLYMPDRNVALGARKARDQLLVRHLGIEHDQDGRYDL